MNSYTYKISSEFIVLRNFLCTDVTGTKVVANELIIASQSIIIIE